ncbi:hypothetical protein [Rhodococcus koreensis]|uniref:hypothetical protein n=1 Tax=Rhodococcus koreensis TaxID=99653 RepID=UPI000B303B12|nr:hypothetical protein [Rhodococcus koreensis]QSE86066.1 hypothetical protein JWS14_44250 [Rhodococcus koreensis]
MYHYFYLAARNPAFSAQQFVDRWRRHAVIAAAAPEFFEPVQCYVQNDVLHDGLPGFPEVVTGFDGLGEFFFENQEAKQPPPDHLSADNREIFGSTGLQRFGGSREVLTGQGEGPYRVVRILVRPDNVSEQAMAEALRTSGTGLPGLGVAISTSTQPELDYDGVLTVWVADLMAAEKLLVSEAWKQATQRLATVADPTRSLTVIAREVVLKGSGPQ